MRYVKRLVALPGERISIRDDRVYLSGVLFQEPYAAPASRPESFPEVVVYRGEVVALEGYALAELSAYLRPTLAMLEPLPPDILARSLGESVSYVAALELDEGFYFVLGDNRSFNASEDSRFFGPLAEGRLQGVLRAIP